MSAFDILNALNIGDEPSSFAFASAQDAHALMQFLDDELVTTVPMELVEIANLETALDLVERNTALLESNLATFKEAIAEGGIDAKTFKALLPSVTAQCGMVGAVFAQYATESLHKPGGSLEAAEYSAEGVKDALKKGWIATQRFFEKMIDKVIALFKRYFTELGRFEGKVNLIEELSKSLEGSAGGAKFAVPEAMQIGGKAAKLSDLSDIVKMLKKPAKVDLGKFMKAIGEAYASVDPAVEGGLKTGEAAIDNAVSAFANELKDAWGFKSAPKGVVEKELPVKEEYEEVLGLDEMVGHKVLVLGVAKKESSRLPVVRLVSTKDKPKKDLEVAAYSVGEIKEVAKILKEVLALAKTLANKEPSAEAKKAFDHAAKLKDRLMKSDDETVGIMPMLDRLKQARQLARLSREPAASMIGHVIYVSSAFYSHAVKSAKATKK